MVSPVIEPRRMRLLNILTLRLLTAAAEQQDGGVANLSKIDSVTRTDVEAKLPDPLSHPATVSEEPASYARQPRIDGLLDFVLF